METNVRGRRQYRRRRSGACDGAGRGRRAGAGRGTGGRSDTDASLATRTAVRAIVAAGAYLAQDMRDPDGLTRPMLRRAALRMAVSRQPALRRLGSAYLRGDPPTADELPARPAVEALPAAQDAAGPAVDIAPAQDSGVV